MNGQGDTGTSIGVCVATQSLSDYDGADDDDQDVTQVGASCAAH